MKYNPKVVTQYFKACGIPEPELEHRFHHTRKWRFDFCWPRFMLALEVQGGIWIQGGHNRGAGLKKEHEKRNEAAAWGWRILYVEPKDLCMLETADLIKRCMLVNNVL